MEPNELALIITSSAALGGIVSPFLLRVWEDRLALKRQRIEKLEALLRRVIVGARRQKSVYLANGNKIQDAREDKVSFSQIKDDMVPAYEDFFDASLELRVWCDALDIRTDDFQKCLSKFTSAGVSDGPKIKEAMIKGGEAEMADQVINSLSEIERRETALVLEAGKLVSQIQDI